MGCRCDSHQSLPLLVTGVEPASRIGGQRHPRAEFIAGNDEEPLDLVARQHVKRLVIFLDRLTRCDCWHQLPWLLPLLGLVRSGSRESSRTKNRQCEHETRTTEEELSGHRVSPKLRKRLYGQACRL